MSTLTIQVENNSVLNGLKKILSVMEGVTIISTKKSVSDQDKLNSATIKAIKDVKAGKTYKANSVDDLLNQCLN